MYALVCVKHNDTLYSSYFTASVLSDRLCCSAEVKVELTKLAEKHQLPSNIKLNSIQFSLQYFVSLISLFTCFIDKVLCMKQLMTRKRKYTIKQLQAVRNNNKNGIYLYKSK